jgi:hypothetical protein
MFVLNHGRKLFLGRYLLRRDKVRGGYWIIFKNSVSWREEPEYNFPWIEVSDEEVARDYPIHYDNYKHHEFLFKEKQE